MPSHLAAFLPGVVETWGYGVVFVSSLLEPIPFLGLFSPGAVITAIGGFLAHQGELNFIWTVTFSFIGIFLGDAAAYFFGRRFGYTLLLRAGRLFSFDEARVEKVRTLVVTHMGKALTVGKFIFPVRTFAPFLAGASGSPRGAFFLFSIAGSCVWSFSMAIAGYFFGFGFEALAQTIGKAFLIGILLAGLVIYGYRFINKNHHVFKRYQVYMIGVNALSIFIFSKVANDLLEKDFLIRLDAWVYTFIPLLYNHFLSTALFFATSLFNIEGVVVMTLGILLYFMFRRKWYAFLVASISSLFSLTAQFFLKNYFMMPRPPEPFLSIGTYSFPSGHATSVTVIAFTLAYLLWPLCTSRLRKVISVILATTLVFTVSFSRLYFGVHWLSDIVGGIALGMFSVTATILCLQILIFIKGALKGFARP